MGSFYMQRNNYSVQMGKYSAITNQTKTNVPFHEQSMFDKLYQSNT